MNMKKTIAAIAAGAVAVSAMATTVSALQDTALTYNLVEKTSVATTGTVVVSSTFNAVDLKDGVIRFAFDDGTSATKYTIKGVSITGRYDADSKQILPITRVTDINAENYSATLAKEGYLDVNVGAEKLLEAETATFTVAVTLEHNLADWQNISAVNSDIADNGLNVNYKMGASTTTTDADTGETTTTPADMSTVTAVKDDTVASQFVASGKTEYKLPFTTAIKGNDNIVNYLQTAKVNGDGSYVNVGAVLNDAIENYESVTFTFNTATSGIKWTDNADTFVNKYSADKLKENNWDRSYFTAFYNDEWDADNSYKSFTQHLYNGTNGIFYTSYDSEGTGYTGFDWTGYNLFQGALVVNENLTMSLAETDYFDWTATSLSFDWDAIMDGAMTGNSYATYLHSMKLATSNTWYWDSMTVTLTAGAEEDATSDAGVTADDEELAEEEVEEEVVEEEVVEEEVEEEVEVEVANPTTGNASVALAVIPVALAAAAVVAKKRN